MHNAPKVVLDKGMCQEARAWAEALAEKEALNHNPDTKDGENLYMACVPRGRTLRPWKGVVAWYVMLILINTSRRENGLVQKCCDF